MPAVSVGLQSNSDAQPIATKRQAEMYCCKYCAKHHTNLGARCALYDIIDSMQNKDEAVQDKYGRGGDTTKLGGMLHKAFMAEIGEEMCQAEVAHHANRNPEFFVSRSVKNVHLYRKMLAVTHRSEGKEEEGAEGPASQEREDDWWSAWDEGGRKRVHQVSDFELYMRRGRYWFWPEGPQPSPYLPWRESPEAQVAAASLFDFFSHVARRLGAEAALEELLQAHGADAEPCPAACFPLDDAVFTAERLWMLWAASSATRRSSSGADGPAWQALGAVSFGAWHARR